MIPFVPVETASTLDIPIGKTGKFWEFKRDFQQKKIPTGKTGKFAEKTGENGNPTTCQFFSIFYYCSFVDHYRTGVQMAKIYMEQKREKSI